AQPQMLSVAAQIRSLGAKALDPAQPFMRKAIELRGVDEQAECQALLVPLDQVLVARDGSAGDLADREPAHAAHDDVDRRAHGTIIPPAGSAAQARAPALRGAAWLLRHKRGSTLPPARRSGP